MDELCHFLGSIGYYRRFIPLFGDTTKPLNKLLREDTKFQWSAQLQSAFKYLRKTLCMKPILQYPNTQKLYILFMDTSHYAYSEVLT